MHIFIFLGFCYLFCCFLLAYGLNVNVSMLVDSGNSDNSPSGPPQEEPLCDNGNKFFKINII